MAMTDRTSDRESDTALEALFQAARSAPPDPSDALMARVLADGLREQTAQRPVAAPWRASPGGWRAGIATVLDGLGGWRSVAGLATAGLTGVWIGFTGTGGIGAVSQALWQTGTVQAVDLLPGEDIFALDLAAGG